MKFSPMLAANATPEQIKHDVMASIKLEGVRGVFRAGPLLTRSLKQFNNPRLQQKFMELSNFAYKHNIVIEGEFYKHGWSFKQIDSACRNSKAEEALELEFHIFDMYVDAEPDAVFETRYFYMDNWVKSQIELLGIKDTFIIPQDKVAKGSAQLLRQMYSDALDKGFEGLVMKRCDTPYKHGRSTLKEEIFVRIKAEETYDGVVLAIIERQHNLCESEINELGYQYKKQDKDQKAGAGIAQTAIVVSAEHGKLVRVSLTRGLKDYEPTENGPSRQHIWENKESFIGKPIRFVGIPVADMDVPRSPRFDVFRDDIEPLYWEHPESDSYGVVFSESDLNALLESDGCVHPVPFKRLYNLASADF